MKRMKQILALSLALLMLLSLCACGGSSDSAAAEPIAAPAEAMYEELAVNTAADYGFAVTGGGDGLKSEANAPEENGDKIIYSANVTVETTAFDESVETLQRMMDEQGGWVESSSIHGSDYYSSARGHAGTRSASYTLRVPSKNFNTMMNGLSALGNVPYSHVYTENVSARYYDAQARLTAYTTQEQRLLEMMDKAETVSDVIAIEEKLTELRYQIENIQTSLNNWDRQVDYSYIYLDLQEVREYTPEAEESFGSRLWRSFTGGFSDAADFGRNLLIWLVGAVPALIGLGVLLLVGRPVFRKVRGRRKKKEAEDTEE